MQRLSNLNLVVALLAFVQALFGALRASEWIQIGSNMLGQGLLLMPLVGTVAYARGLFLAFVVALYVAFGAGLLLARQWAWSAGLSAVVINLVLVVSALIQGGSLLEGLLWSIIPLTIIVLRIAFGTAEVAGRAR
jgi:hypothetical protein